MTDSENQTELMSAKYMVENNEAEVLAEPVVFVPKPTPNANPMGNLHLIAGVCGFILVVYCIVTSVGETQKAPSDRNSWLTWLVDYSVEKQKREGRAPERSGDTYGPFGY